MIRVGIVGCGSIANVHAWVLSQIEDVKIAGFVDIKKERAEQFSKQYTHGEAPAYESLTEFLDRENPDTIHICTPHYLHVPMAVEAMKKGVSVFSEKPPAINMEQFDELVRVTKEQNVKVGFCFQNRYNKTIEIADEIINSGRLGKVTGVRAFVTWRRDMDYYETDWKGKLAAEGGGALINQSIHTLDLMLRYLGKPDKVSATVSNHHLNNMIEVEDTVEAWLNYEDGKRGCFYATTAYASDAPVILEIQCGQGSISIMEKMLIVREVSQEPQIITINDGNGAGKVYWGNGHLACIKDYYAKLKSGERFLNDPEGVRTTMETMMKIYDYR